MRNIKWVLLFAVVFFGQLISAGVLSEAIGKFRINWDEVQKLLESGANPNDSDSSGRSAFNSAIYWDVPDHIFELFLVKGVDVNAKDSTRKTPLMVADNYGAHPREKDMRRFPSFVKKIRLWSIENQKPITGAEDIEILDGGNPGSYKKDFNERNRQQ